MRQKWRHLAVMHSTMFGKNHQHPVNYGDDLGLWSIRRLFKCHLPQTWARCYPALLLHHLHTTSQRLVILFSPEKSENVISSDCLFVCLLAV